MNCLVFILEDTDGSKKEMGFSTREDARMYAHNEGDHLLEFYEKSS